MTAKTRETTAGQRKLSRYATNGMLGGFFLGLIVGVVASGPHFSEWPALRSLSVILGSGIGGYLLGYIFPILALGAVAGNPDEPTAAAADGDSDTKDSGSCGEDEDGGHCVGQAQ